MRIHKMLVSGDKVFISRYRALFEAMNLRFEQLSYLYGDKPLKRIF